MRESVWMQYARHVVCFSYVWGVLHNVHSHIHTQPHTGPGDISDACLCELGSKKIPYVYNNSFVPQLTALVSMRKGQLFYTNTYVQVNQALTITRAYHNPKP